MGWSAPCGIIFDLDGTLIDTLDDIALSVNELLSGMGREPLSRDVIRGYVGEGLSNLLARAAGTDDQSLVAELVSKYKPIYRRRMFDHTRMYPGLDAALDVLAAAGHPFAILSNKSHDFIAPFVERMLDRWGWVRVCGQQPGVPRKPDPAQALTIAAAMSRQPVQVVFVGDAATDVQTARAASMKNVAVTWGYRSRAELAAAGATTIIDHPGELDSAIGAA